MNTETVTNDYLNGARDGIYKFFYFIHNAKVVYHDGTYVPAMIVEVDWPSGQDHMFNKWLQYSHYRRMEDVFLALFADLDTAHRNLFIDYVNENQHI